MDNTDKDNANEIHEQWITLAGEVDKDAENRDLEELKNHDEMETLEEKVVVGEMNVLEIA